MVKPCYLYLRESARWVWLQGDEILSWESGLKRRAKNSKNSYSSWLEKYPGRPTGLPEDIAR